MLSKFCYRIPGAVISISQPSSTFCCGNYKSPSHFRVTHPSHFYTSTLRCSVCYWTSFSTALHCQLGEPQKSFLPSSHFRHEEIAPEFLSKESVLNLGSPHVCKASMDGFHAVCITSEKIVNFCVWIHFSRMFKSILSFNHILEGVCDPLRL